MTKRIPEMTELRRWEDQHERELEDVAMKEEAKKKERRKAAEDELHKWHEERHVDIEKRRAAKRTEQELAQKTKEQAVQQESSNVWERVAELVNTNARTESDCRDTSRMAALLIHLKTSPVAVAC